MAMPAKFGNRQRPYLGHKLALLCAVLAGSTPVISACSVRVVDAMFKVLPGQQNPPALAKPVAAARGELIHVQVVVLDDKISAGTQITSTVKNLGNVTVRAVSYINMTLPEGLAPGNNIENRSRPGLFPDALAPLNDLGLYEAEHMTSGAPQAFWLSIKVPRTASPGLYQGTWSAGSACTASFSVCHIKKEASG